MRLTLQTDYALRVLMYLASRPAHLATIQEISDAYGISRNHLMKVVLNLARAGFVETVRGRSGGLRLQRAASAIGIGDVVRRIEDDFCIVECFNDRKSACVIGGVCRLQGLLREALNAYLAVLDRHTLADLMTAPRALARRLGVVAAE